ncbi:uncharacterized protein METZ01_LOCUS494859, partial [marine metagenome]
VYAENKKYVELADLIPIKICLEKIYEFLLMVSATIRAKSRI